MKQMKIGIIGMGKMGEAIVQGLRASEKGRQYAVSGTTRTDESAKETSKRLGISCHTDNEKLARESDLVILCVKPHHAEKIAIAISTHLRKSQLLLSVCASITIKQLSEWTERKAPIIRVMPNTPCLIREGMTVLAPGPDARPEQIKLTEEIFGTLGRTTVVEESLMDGVTGLSGCGPAYVYLIIEALSEAGVKIGLPREKATLLAAQTLKGAAQMVLERGVHPAALKDEVTTPAGCTIDGLMALEEGKLRVTLIKAVLAATKRSISLRG
jgi:pyrroline-5-carboxylate reductase